jgi:hypothetical protein
LTSKIICMLCAILFTTPAVHAQIIRGYGLKLGAVSASQTWDFDFNVNLPVEARWGYDAGIFVEVLDMPYFSVLAEVHYIQKGFSVTLPITTPVFPEGTGQYATLRPRADYLSIPLLAKVRFETGLIDPCLYAGPRFDILIGSKAEGANAVFDELKGTGTGAVVGAGVEIPTAFVPSLLAEIRYSTSFDDAFVNNHLTVKNHSFEILVGVRL